MIDDAGLTPAELAQLYEQRVEVRMIRQAGGIALERLLEMQLQRTILVPTPSVGAEWSTTVPAGVTWEVLAFRHTLTTSAVVANRIPTIRVRDQDGNTLMRFAPPAVVTANVGTPMTYAAGIGGDRPLSENVSLFPPPFVTLSSGYTIGSLTSALDVGDAYSAIVVTVREWSSSRVAQRLSYLLSDLDSAGGIS